MTLRWRIKVKSHLHVILYKTGIFSIHKVTPRFARLPSQRGSATLGFSGFYFSAGIADIPLNSSKNQVG